MQILVIDDLRVPVLSRFPENAEIKIARNSTQGIVYLNRQSFDAVFWDHDLGGEDTTRIVIKYLIMQALNGSRIDIPENYVHSANNVGADWLIKALRDYPLQYDALKVQPLDFFIV